MISLYEIIEHHIILTLPAWRCLFTVRNYMTLFNTTSLHTDRWSSGMSLASHGEHSWFETHTILCSNSYFFIADIVLYFLLSFSHNG